MTFEDYLVSKRIDQKAFQEAELKLFENWKLEFEQMHPESFTVQKLYLINPIRRKYTLKEIRNPQPIVKAISELNPPILETGSALQQASITNEVKSESSEEIKPASTAPKPARPVFKPRPK